MKLGSETGSLCNHIFSRMTKGQPTPEVGMGCTILAWTDRHAGTIVKIDSSTKYPVLFIQEDHYKMTNEGGIWGNQEYEFTADPKGLIWNFRCRNEKWELVTKSEKGRWILCCGEGLRIGTRDRYYDPSF